MKLANGRRHGVAETLTRPVQLTMISAALGLILGFVVSGPAQAQFVCQDVTLGTGDGATAAGANSVACGTGATASGIQSTAIGKNAQATSAFTTATGMGATASGGNSSAFGNGATASGSLSNATGYSAQATGNNSTATGANAAATGDFSTATGTNSVASSNNSTAMGESAAATGVGATAIGQGAQANFANSAAFGAGAQTTAANQVAIGTATNTYTMGGLTSAASTAAQTGPVSVVTTDASGNLAAVDLASLGLGASSTALSEINSRLDEHDKKISKNTEGVAIALAMAGVPTLTASEKFAMSANWGTFEGENGFAGGAAVRLDSNIQVNGGIGFGNETVGGRAGVRIGW